MKRLLEVMTAAIDMIMDCLSRVKRAVSNSINYICTALKDFWHWLCGTRPVEAQAQERSTEIDSVSLRRRQIDLCDLD